MIFSPLLLFILSQVNKSVLCRAQVWKIESNYRQQGTISGKLTGSLSAFKLPSAEHRSLKKMSMLEKDVLNKYV